MTRPTYWILLAATVCAAPLTVFGTPLADVEIRVIPLMSAGSSDVTSALPVGDSIMASGAAYVLEVWLSDVGTLNTGLVSAFVDLAYDTQWTDAIAFHHSNSFRPFGTDPTTLDASAGLVYALGGNTPGFQPQGIAPNWVRLGWIDMVAGHPSSPQLIEAAATEGLWGIGVYNRLVGQVDSLPVQWTVTPDPASAILLGLAAALALSRRNAVPLAQCPAS